MREAQPIDDIRSTADYRRSVAANLLEEFLARLQMQNSTILQAWNKLPTEQAIATLLNCCASTRWASTLTASRPFADEEALVAAADAVWSTMQEPDWHEAFAAHPRIGARKANHASPQSLTWSQQEQSSTSHAESRILAQLAEGNARYESIFGFTYIVCATGKSAEQMLSILQTRLTNDRPTELKEAAEQQRQIMHIRLRKWLHP
jgi:OHCU decarboxylase